MNLTRRSFVRTAALVAAATITDTPAAPRAAKVKIGSCTLDLDKAREAGLDGVQVGVGGEAAELDISKAATRAAYKARMGTTHLPICSLMMGLLNQCPLATDPRGPAWLQQCIDAARDLGVTNILLAFFGNGDLLAGNKLKDDAFAAVVKRVKEAAPRAKDAGVTLAIENLLNAEQNLRLLDAIHHDSVSIYYDVFNTGKTQEYDSPAEIRQLKGRISQFHYKNGPQFLDADKDYFAAVSAAVKDIAFDGWIVLETSAPSNNPVADAKRNADFVRTLFA